MTNNPTRFFLDLPVQYQAVDGAEMAYRVVGEGPPILLVHGWPLWGFTWRKILPALSEHHRCYVVDLLGAGDTRWTEETDFTFDGQANALKQLTAALDIHDYAIIAHDTGATISRQLTLIDSERVRALVLMNTEIPNHRPFAIEWVQRAVDFPGARAAFRMAAGSRMFLRSKLGFGDVFVNKDLLDGDFYEHLVRPLVDHPRRLEGQLRYVKGIDWNMLDSLEKGHGEIHQPVLFLWGEQDPWFPVHRAKEMVGQLANCAGFETLPGKLFVHEESHHRVASRSLEFLAS